METKQLWVARNKDYSLFLYTSKPTKQGNRFVGEIDEDGYYALSIQLNKGLLPEVTFENSPQEVELKLIEK
jgi:hypothetical protein